MHCPRLNHYVRLNNDGSVGNCGHMVNGKGFDSVDSLHNSKWSSDLRRQMDNGVWPDECVRCQRSEQAKGTSIRTNSIRRHNVLKPIRDDYLIVGGVLDNICNSACQSCNPQLSTKIGSLATKEYPRINNYERFKDLPSERILELDVNGGEPTASPNYKKVLKNLPPNTKIVRMNTNGSRMIQEVEDVLNRGTMVIVTLSLDGIGKVHDYTRWPIRWQDYVDTVDRYLELKRHHRLLRLDFWTTVSCLNIEDLPNIIEFAQHKGIAHDWAFLNKPSVLSVRHKNVFTERVTSYEHVASDENNQKELNDFINMQDRLRKIDVKDYFNFL